MFFTKFVGNSYGTIIANSAEFPLSIARGRIERYSFHKPVVVFVAVAPYYCGLLAPLYFAFFTFICVEIFVFKGYSPFKSRIVLYAVAAAMSLLIALFAAPTLISSGKTFSD